VTVPSSGSGEDAVGVAAQDGDGAAGPVDVAAFERRPFVRAQPGLGGEHDERPVQRAELDGERVDLVEGERVHLLGPGLRVATRLDRRVRRQVAPADGGVQ
jgi:flavin-dependent dehydrogenase